MKRFRFSLEAVAIIRHHEEEQARQKFAAATRTHREGLDHLDRLEHELETVMAERRSSTPRHAADFRQLQEWQSLLQQKVEQQARVVQKLAQAVDQANQELRNARQRREAVEKIRSHRLAHHEQEQLKVEQKMLDDLANRSGLARGLLNETGL